MGSRRSVLGTAFVVVASFGAAVRGAEGATAASFAGAADRTASSEEPIVVYTMAPINVPAGSQREATDVAEVAEQFLNDGDLLNGRTIDVRTCDAGYDPNLTANCARQAVDDGAVAVVGSVAGAPSYLPILGDAGIPYITALAYLEPEWSDPIVYSINGGTALVSIAIAEYAERRDYQTLNIVATDIPATDSSITEDRANLSARGIAVGTVVKIPPTATDVSAFVAEATTDADAVAAHLGPEGTLAYLKAVQQSGQSTGLLTDVALIGDDYIEQTGDAMEGISLVSAFPPVTDERWADFRGAVDKYGSPDIDIVSSTGQGTWLSYQVFAAIANQVDGELSAQSFRAALDGASNIEIPGGLLPPLDFTTPFDNPKYSRLFSRNAYFITVTDGEMVPFESGEPFDASNDYPQP